MAERSGGSTASQAKRWAILMLARLHAGHLSFPARLSRFNREVVNQPLDQVFIAACPQLGEQCSMMSQRDMKSCLLGGETAWVEALLSNRFLMFCGDCDEPQIALARKDCAPRFPIAGSESLSWTSSTKSGANSGVCLDSHPCQPDAARSMLRTNGGASQ